IPIAIDIVFRHQHYIDFIKWSIVSGLITLVIIIPLNHIRYNLFSKHAPIFYGSQPWTYYIINDLVNVNIIYRLAIVGIILINLISRLVRLIK
ncbi:unnamed protein product, partial [Rotaria sp. Silwood1]